MTNKCSSSNCLLLLPSQRPHFYVDSLDDPLLDPAASSVVPAAPPSSSVTVTAAAAISSRLSDSEFSDIEESTGLPRGHGQLPGVDPNWSARR